MNYTMRLAYQSHYWYNDGLKKANIRDLTGAIASLRRSLQYNRENIAARNLLGLVYYGRGDVVEALVEWILSKNFQSRDNIANYYISKVQEVPGELEAINAAVKKYNQALVYAQQNGEDMAIIQLKKAVAEHPTYVKAYQLLGLLYIQTEQYTNARTVLRTAHKLDTTDPITLKYVHELGQIRKERAVSEVSRKTGDEQTVTYTVGNETIIQPVSASLKEQMGRNAMINMAVGTLIGIAVMWFLIMPAILSFKQGKINEQTVAFSDQIAAQEAQISALQKELEKYRASTEAGEKAKATGEATQQSYESVLNIYQHIYKNDMSDNAMLEEMLKVNPDSLGTVGRERYDEITGILYPRMCADLYSTAKKNFEVANYEYAVTNLEKIMSMDEGYSKGGAKLLLAQTYEKQGNQDQANVLYQQVVEEYPDSDAAKTAQEALDAQNKTAEKPEEETEEKKEEKPEE